MEEQTEVVRGLTAQEGRVVLELPAGVEVVEAAPVWVVGELFEEVVYYQEGVGPMLHQLAQVGQAVVEMVTVPPVLKHFFFISMNKYDCD